MEDDETLADVFAIPDFWKSSRWIGQPIASLNDGNPFFALDVSKEPDLPLKTGNEEQPGFLHEDFFKLPPILGGLDIQGPELQPPPHPIHDFDGSDTLAENQPSSGEDLWLFHDEDSVKPPEYKSWDEFDEPDQDNSAPAFLTESGPAAFDAFLASRDNRDRNSLHVESYVIDGTTYCASLLNLALGRGSLLFKWDERRRTFVKTAAHKRTSGYSSESLGGVDNICLSCASSMRSLRSFVDRTFSSSPSPCRVALAGAIDKLLLAIQSELGIQGRRARSILQLQHVVKPVLLLLVYFKELVGKLSRTKTDEEILSLLFQEAQAAEYREKFLRDAIHEVLQMVSKPWTDFVEEWLGLKAEEGTVLTKTGPGKGFVKVENRMWVDDQGFELDEPDFFLDEDRMPSFVSEETAQMIFETGRNLRFLRGTHPDHVLSQQHTVTSAHPPKLKWHFSWESSKRLEAKAQEYEICLSRRIQGRHLATSVEDNWADYSILPSWPGLQVFGKVEAEIEAGVFASMSKLNQPPDKEGEDSLIALIKNHLFEAGGRSVPDEEFSPHWSLLPLLSFGPVVAAQARLVNRECMKLLFTAHDLRVHLDLQKQYHLLGNGVFCSQLSHALFDPDLDTAERQAGVALSGGTMGLRLSSRENWPPASSELRLALMGVLSDSYQLQTPSVPTKHVPLSHDTSNLPGDMSFAVRDLSPEEIERCIDPDSLEALDFLRLSYKPPAALQPIMTPMILIKYDRLFKLLLRVLRMLYVTKQLFRDVPRDHRQQRMSPGLNDDGNDDDDDNAVLRFRIEAHHFVAQITTYFFDTGITRPWRYLENWLDRLEANIARDVATSSAEGDAMGTDGVCSPDRLRERHEQALDDMMSALLLRKRQLPVMRLLEEIFSLILRFAKLMRTRAMRAARRARGASEGGAERTAAAGPRELYLAFRKKVEVFITVCKGLGEKGSYGTKKGRRGENDSDSYRNAIEGLVLMLDWGDYYGKKSWS